jgi:hypothetical protein
MARPWSNAQRVRGYLRKHHVRCQKCGFDLFGLNDPSCPECGCELLIDDLLPPDELVIKWRCIRAILLTLALGAAAIAAWMTVGLFDVPFPAEYRIALLVQFWGVAVVPWLPLARGRALFAAAMVDQRARQSFIRGTSNGLVIFGAIVGAIVSFCLIAWRFL